MKIEYLAECTECQATGLYTGGHTSSLVATVCRACKGTGSVQHTLNYIPFTQRKDKPSVRTVLASDIFNVGVPKEVWENNPEILKAPGKEDRNGACPAWWYQAVDYTKKPDWKECIGAGRFTSCQYFPTKDKCWERWDKEYR